MYLEDLKANVRNAYCLSDQFGWFGFWVCWVLGFFYTVFFVFAAAKNSLIGLC